MIDSMFWGAVRFFHEEAGLLYFYISIGYVFIRCRSIGYGYSSVIVIWFISLVYLIESMTYLHLSDAGKVMAMLVGTLAGGWRYLMRFNTGFGFPFFSLPNIFEKAELYFDKRRARRAFAEELGKEQARKHANDSANSQGSGSSSRSQERKNYDSSKRSSSRKKTDDKEKQSSSGREKFNKAREKKDRNSRGSETAWDILEIPEGSSKADIKTAYRRQAGRFHPDKMPDSIRGDADLEDAYNAKFIKIKNAFDRLNK